MGHLSKTRCNTEDCKQQADPDQTRGGRSSLELFVLLAVSPRTRYLLAAIPRVEIFQDERQLEKAHHQSLLFPPVIVAERPTNNAVRQVEVI